MEPERGVRSSSGGSRRAMLGAMAGGLLSAGTSADAAVVYDDGPVLKRRNDPKALKKVSSGTSPNLGLKYDVMREGTCDPAKYGDFVRAKHKFWFEGFEKGVPREVTQVGIQEVGDFQEPKKFKLGINPIDKNKFEPPTIQDALLGMKVGEVRRVVLPAKLAWMERGRPFKLKEEYPSIVDQDIPPNADLYYQLEMAWTGPAQLAGCTPPWQEV